MNNFGNDYASILMHQARMQEMIEKAEQERQVRGFSEIIKDRVRRIVRINNNPTR